MSWKQFSSHLSQEDIEANDFTVLRCYEAGTWTRGGAGLQTSGARVCVPAKKHRIIYSCLLKTTQTCSATGIPVLGVYCSFKLVLKFCVCVCVGGKTSLTKSASGGTFRSGIIGDR